MTRDEFDALIWDVAREYWEIDEPRAQLLAFYDSVTPPPPAGDGGVIVVAQLVAACHDLADKHAARSRVAELRKIRDQGYEGSDDQFMISWIHLESMITALDAWDALSASAQAQATEG